MGKRQANPDFHTRLEYLFRDLGLKADEAAQAVEEFKASNAKPAKAKPAAKGDDYSGPPIGPARRRSERRGSQP